MTNAPRISIVIPTFGREQVLVDTIRDLLLLEDAADELLIVDQTPQHEPATEMALQEFALRNGVRVIRLDQPSITHAMNFGLLQATGEVVLFVDDDVRPFASLIGAHRAAHGTPGVRLVAGRVLQPWHVDGSRPLDRLAREESGIVAEFIGCNFSVHREWAIGLGGFDERFLKVAYRYEAEFGERARRAGVLIHFVPEAALHHLRAERGGTRSYGDHLRTLGPAHALGGYYYLIRAQPSGWIWQFLAGPVRAVATRYHLRRPWYIPVMLASHVCGMLWAVVLCALGPRLIRRDDSAAQIRRAE